MFWNMARWTTFCSSVLGGGKFVQRPWQAPRQDQPVLIHYKTYRGCSLSLAFNLFHTFNPDLEILRCWGRSCCRFTRWILCLTLFWDMFCKWQFVLPVLWKSHGYNCRRLVDCHVVHNAGTLPWP
jgi:hypothetical protein